MSKLNLYKLPSCVMLLMQLDFLAFWAIVLNLFLIIDPIGCLPVFIAITKDNTREQRRKMIMRATIIAFLVLLLFALIGKPLMDYFGISIPAMRIAGGVLLFIIGMEMLFGRISRTESSDRELKEAEEKQDVSITPLAIPLLAGPGAITAVILHSGTSSIGPWAVILALLFVLGVGWLLLSLSEHITKRLGTIGITVTGRVMGLLLIFVSAQLVIDGLVAIGFASA
jgi:multiple antibiotic resistance protein